MPDVAPRSFSDLKLACTGRTGSIGQRLPEAVVGLQTRLEAEVADMRAELTTVAPEVLIHLAALTSVSECARDPDRAFKLNCAAASRWLHAAEAARVKRFVYVSTSHVFQATTEPEFLEPARSPDARSAYGRSKAAAEAELIHRASTLGIELRIARVFSVIAEDMRPWYLYPALVTRAKTQDLTPLPGYKNTRDFITTKAAADCLWQIAHAETACQIFHVCSGRPQTVRGLAEAVFLRYGYKLPDLDGLFPSTEKEANYMISQPTEY